MKLGNLMRVDTGKRFVYSQTLWDYLIEWIFVKMLMNLYFLVNSIRIKHVAFTVVFVSQIDEKHKTHTHQNVCSLMVFFNA